MKNSLIFVTNKQRNIIKMEKELIGLDTYLYTFELAMEKEYMELIDKLKDEGTITIVFMENKLAFEIKNKKQ